MRYIVKTLNIDQTFVHFSAQRDLAHSIPFDLTQKYCGVTASIISTYPSVPERHQTL